MRAFRRHRAVAVTAALVVLGAVAGPVQAGPPQPGPVSWLTASPTASPITFAAGATARVTVANTDRRTTSSALTVTLARSPSSAPFAIVGDGCAGTILRPGNSCTVEVGYSGPQPTIDHNAKLTVASGKPKASVTSLLEVGVSFADVCAARGGSAGIGGTITVLGATFAVGDRCDWGSSLATAEYNAAFEVLAAECRDLASGGTIGYTVTGETGRPAIGCVID